MGGESCYQLYHINQFTQYNIYLCAIIRTIYVPTSMSLLCLVNGQTCEYSLIHQLDSLDNPFFIFASQTGYESQVNLIQEGDLKRRPFFSQKRTWSPIFGHINTTFLQATDDVLYCWRSNCEDCTGGMVRPLFMWTNLNKIANLINKRGINFNY